MKITYTDYLHGDKDSNWNKLGKLQSKHAFILEENAQSEFIYTNYEVELEMELDTETGKAHIIKVDGNPVQYPKTYGMPKDMINCLDCDFSSDSECNWHFCKPHEDEYYKGTSIKTTSCGNCMIGDSEPIGDNGLCAFCTLLLAKRDK